MTTIPKVKVHYPIAMIWPVNETRIKEMKDKPGKALCSNSFNASDIPGLQYYLAIFPNYEGSPAQTSIYFYLKFPDEIKIEANFNIVIESRKCVRKFNHLFDKPSGWGGRFCTFEELIDPEKGYIVNEKLTIKMDGYLTVEKEKEMPAKGEPISERSDALCLGLWNQDNKDFAIVAGGKQIMAHKLVLAAQSRVFARMIESGMRETKENKVMIEDFPFDIVEMAIKLCYHHSLVTNTTLLEKLKLIQFFDKYEIQALKDNHEAYLSSEIDESTVCSLANAALLSNALKLEEKCAEFLRDCLKMTKPVKDLDLLDKDFASLQFKNAFYHVSK